jgi:DNA-binding transcriptional ArsR family regulator
MTRIEEFKMTTTTISKSTQPRNFQELPPLYFVAMDDWVEKLGEKSFILYLKLWTQVDRTGEEHCIRTQTTKLIKKLGMAKSTYYRLLAPLYEYGLIDLEEYEDSKQKGSSKPVNIVVHKYPQNEFKRATMPLEKCRDWEKRTLENYSFTKKGGRKKKEVSTEDNTDTNTKVDTKEEVKPEVKTEVVLDEAVALTIDLNEDKLTKNEVDIKKLKEWASSTKEPVDIVQQVIKNMANYEEPIKAMKTFINRGIKMIKEAQAEAERKANYVPSIPMFDWLNGQ